MYDFSKQTVVWTIILVLIMFLAFLYGASSAGPRQKPAPAKFERGKVIVVASFRVTPDGGTFEVPAKGTPVDGITVQVPGGSTDNPFTLTVAYDTGLLRLPSGIPGGTALVLQADHALAFQSPIKVTVHFVTKGSYKTVVGYEIDSGGRLHSLDIVDVNMAKGKASFLAFKLLTLTWVYVDDD